MLLIYHVGCVIGVFGHCHTVPTTTQAFLPIAGSFTLLITIKVRFQYATYVGWLHDVKPFSLDMDIDILIDHNYA